MILLPVKYSGGLENAVTVMLSRTEMYTLVVGNGNLADYRNGIFIFHSTVLSYVSSS